MHPTNDGPRRPVKDAPSPRPRGKSRPRLGGGWLNLGEHLRALGLRKKSDTGQSHGGKNRWGLSLHGLDQHQVVAPRIIIAGSDTDTAPAGGGMRSAADHLEAAPPATEAAHHPLFDQGVDDARDPGLGEETEMGSDFIKRWRDAVRAHMGPEEFEKFCLAMRESRQRRLRPKPDNNSD